MTTSVTQDSSLIYFALAALLLPLLSFIISFSIPNRYSWTVSLLAPLLLLISFICASILLFHISSGNSIQQQLPWFTMGGREIFIGFLVDNRSAIMMVVVSSISFLVHLYSTGYMAGDSEIQKYFAMLSFFTFAMLGIVMTNNLLLLFFFWELVGFASYQLISFWHAKPKAANAATKAFIMNRIGDAGFLIGLMILWTYGGSVTIDSIHLTVIPTPYLTAAGICIFCGVIGKSAQFPLFTWLPDAMEGPTPVSALIHAATMVAAGVFLLARVYFLFTPNVLLLVAVVGSITSLIGAVSALRQFDIKKILAYSTISQLGLMIMGIGAGDPIASELHLFTHAFFKAGLFLGVGSVIHALNQASRHTSEDIQDIRNLGGLAKRMPITFLAFAIAGCGLAGIPFSAGFLSKDALLSGLLHGNFTFFIIGSLVSILTVIYTFRLIWFIFFAKDSLSLQIQKDSIADPPMIMRIVTIILAVTSLWFMVSWSPVNFSGWIYQLLQTKAVAASEIITIVSALLIIITGLSAYFYFRNRSLGQINSIASGDFGVDLIYNRIFVASSLKLADAAHTMDRKWIDGLLHVMASLQVAFAHLIGWWDNSIVDGSVDGLAMVAKGTGSITRSFSSGKIQSYILWSMLGLIIFIVWILL